MFIVLTKSSRWAPCVCICLYLKYVLYIICLSVVYHYFCKCVACLFFPVPADALFLLQHWLPDSLVMVPCKHVMWDFFASLPLPSSPDLFQCLTVGLPLLAIKLSQVHRCNDCSVCESIVHISCFWGLRKKKKTLCSDRKWVLLIWRGISTVEKNPVWKLLGTQK